MKCRLEDISLKISKGSTPRGKVNYSSDENNFFLRVTDLNELQHIKTAEYTLSDDDIKKNKMKIWPPNTVLVSIEGTVGKVAILKKPMSFNQAIAGIIPDEGKVIPEYLMYYLRQTPTIASILKGTIMPALRLGDLSNIELDLPDLETQKKIVHILSAIDDRIESNTQTNRFLVEESQLLFDDYVKNNDLEYRKISSFNPILETGKRPSGGIGNIRDGIPSVGAESIKGIGYFDYAKAKYVSVDFFKKMKKGIVHGYELLIYKDGGKPGYFIPNFSMFGEGFPYEECAINEHVFLLDFNEIRLNIFAYYFFNSAKTRHRLHVLGSKTAAIPGINQQDILNLEMPLLDHMSKNTLDLLVLNTKKVLSNSKQNYTLSTIRDTLLPRLVDGAIDIDGVTV